MCAPTTHCLCIFEAKSHSVDQAGPTLTERCEASRLHHLTTNQPCKECTQVNRSLLPPPWMCVLPVQPGPEGPGAAEVVMARERSQSAVLHWTPRLGKGLFDSALPVTRSHKHAVSPGEGDSTVSHSLTGPALFFLWSRQN